MTQGYPVPAGPQPSRLEPSTLTDAELERALTLAAIRRSVFDDGRLQELLAERRQRRERARRRY